jgi:hypothetical protein
MGEAAQGKDERRRVLVGWHGIHVDLCEGVSVVSIMCGIGAFQII